MRYTEVIKGIYNCRPRICWS